MPSPAILKGGLSYAGSRPPAVPPLVFQFNPETMTRLQVYSEQANAVTESIRFELVLNAVEGLEREVPAVLENGIYPQLAVIEELMAQQRKTQRRHWVGWLFSSNKTDFLLFTYGERNIPVKIQRLNIKESLHNNQLKPIYAKVDVALRVLTERELRGKVAGRVALEAYKQYRHLKALITKTQNL